MKNPSSIYTIGLITVLVCATTAYSQNFGDPIISTEQKILNILQQQQIELWAEKSKIEEEKRLQQVVEHQVRRDAIIESEKNNSLITSICTEFYQRPKKDQYKIRAELKPKFPNDPFPCD